MSNGEDRCVECGTPLPANCPRGLCPRCALNGALNLDDFEVRDPTEERSPSDSSRKFDSPRPFGDYELLEEIAQTVTRAEDVDAEIRYLIAVVSN